MADGQEMAEGSGSSAVRSSNEKKEEDAAAPAAAAAAAAKEPQSALWIVCLITALFASGVYDFFVNVELNGCAMTYMYEWPTYVPVPDLPEAVAAAHPNYGLYAYGEGKSVERLEEGAFDGIPVLFIPGNSGSYKQVRSLASVALRKAIEDSDYEVHFDYFSVDFNEEFSALYGGSLSKQSDYVAACVDHILSKYKKVEAARRPKSVALVGHSIGGLIAKSLFARPDFKTEKINTIITLATPHEPVVVLDTHTRDFYDAVHERWNGSRAANRFPHLAFVSVGGGERDIQVRSGLTKSAEADVNVITTDAAGIWVSTDHRCIVWCKQLVLSLKRALFDVVDGKTGQITTDVKHRRDAFRYHLLDRRGGKKYRVDSPHPETLKFDKDGFWTDVLKRQFTFSRESVATNSYILIKAATDDPKQEMLAIDAVNLENANWLFGCKATTVYKNSRICDVGENLSDKISKLAPSRGKRRLAHADLRKLAKRHGYTHLVVFVPKHAEHVRVHVDIYTSSSRHVAYTPPRWISFWKAHPIVERTTPEAVYYNVSLAEMEEPWQAYTVRAVPLGKCTDDNHFGMMRFSTAWDRDATQTLIGTKNMTNALTARLQSTRPKDGVYYRNPEMQVYLNPACRYRIEIQSNLPAMFGQIVRFYAAMVLPFSIAVVMVTLSQQLKALEAEYAVPSFLGVISKKVTPMSVVMPGRILSSILSAAAIAPYVPRTDFVRIAESGVDFAVLPILLFFVCIGLVGIVSVAAWACVVVFGNAANKAATTFVAGYAGVQSEILVDVALGGLNKFPFVISGILMAVSAATCGDVGLCLGTFCNFLHLFDMYKDYLQELLKEAAFPGDDRKKTKEALLNSVHFQFSLSLLWALTAVFNAPSLLAWSRSLPLAQLSPDPSLLPSLFLAGSLAVTWGGAGRPNPELCGYGRLSFAIQFLAVMVVAFGSVSMYRVNYFLCATFALIAVQQLVPRRRPTKEEAEAAAREVAEKEQQQSGQSSKGDEAEPPAQGSSD